MRSQSQPPTSPPPYDAKMRARPMPLPPLPSRRALRSGTPVLALLALGLWPLLSGCITIYQPLLSLQRPVAIDRRQPNFTGLRISLRCLPSDDLPQNDAAVLCRRVESLFAQQGALVDVATTAGASASAAVGSEKGSTPPALIVELSVRRIHSEGAGLLWIVCYLTGSLVPAISSETFAQDVTVRDSHGFLLAQESYQARFVSYFGLGAWGVNFALNHTLRAPKEELSDEASERDFSADLYDQLTQVAFQAHLRSVVLGGFASPAPAPTPSSTAPSKNN